eukprot:Rhum_TRINITY_DN11375_c3_g1::Rhum_TRINITY_DN11375_c3_g1_i1::g.43763::m.43763
MLRHAATVAALVAVVCATVPPPLCTSADEAVCRADHRCAWSGHACAVAGTGEGPPAVAHTPIPHTGNECAKAGEMCDEGARCVRSQAAQLVCISVSVLKDFDAGSDTNDVPDWMWVILTVIAISMCAVVAYFAWKSSHPLPDEAASSPHGQEAKVADGRPSWRTAADTSGPVYTQYRDSEPASSPRQAASSYNSPRSSQVRFDG